MRSLPGATGQEALRSVECRQCGSEILELTGSEHPALAKPSECGGEVCEASNRRCLALLQEKAGFRGLSLEREHRLQRLRKECRPDAIVGRGAARSAKRRPGVRGEPLYQLRPLKSHKDLF